MNGLSPTEKKFEEHIKKHLNSLDYSSKNFTEYDRKLCLIKEQVIEFIKTTQPEKWEKLNEIYNFETEKNTLFRISSEILKRGIIDVLRNSVVDRGVYLDLCYFQPNSDLNPDH